MVYGLGRLRRRIRHVGRQSSLREAPICPAALPVHPTRRGTAEDACMTASAIRRPPPSSLLEPLPQSRINQVATPSFVGAVWVRSYYSLCRGGCPSSRRATQSRADPSIRSSGSQNLTPQHDCCRVVGWGDGTSPGSIVAPEARLSTQQVFRLPG